MLQRTPRRASIRGMTPYLVTQGAEPRPWRRVTLRSLGYNESFLETIVATSPDVLGIDPYETGIGPYLSRASLTAW